MKFLKRLIKPKSAIGKLAGAVGSLLGISGGGALAGLDLGFTVIVALAIAAGYLFGWSREQLTSFIKFLDERRTKKKE